jgi:hypothetical protein
MNTKKLLVLLGTLIVAAVIISACGTAGEPGPQGPAGPAGPAGPQGEPGVSAMASDLTCTECHNDTAIITGKKAPWSTSVHGSGTAADYAGGRDGCTGCHSGASFSKMIAAGQTPATYDGTAADVTHQDCRTCHQIHVTYTGEDWALETTVPVELYAYEGATFDGGKGNLCGVCHQPRRAFAAVDGMVDWNSTHYGPHHGPQTAVLLGIAGAGEAAAGKPGAHYSMVEDTCRTCHLGENDNHTFLPTIAACQECHADAENFDINGLQTEVEAKLAELHELLVAKGMLTEDGTSVVGVYPEAEAAALWNYILIAEEDKSMGAHNPNYINALLDASIATMSGE